MEYKELTLANSRLCAEVDRLRAELAAWKSAVEGLTPTGSEYVNDPKTCGEYIRKRSEYPKMIVDLRAELKAAREANVRLLDAGRSTPLTPEERSSINAFYLTQGKEVTK